jgi:hypothetical protein
VGEASTGTPLVHSGGTTLPFDWARPAISFWTLDGLGCDPEQLAEPRQPHSLRALVEQLLLDLG